MNDDKMPGNESVKSRIHKCFELLHKDDQAKFVKHFKDQPHEGPQIRDTYPELVLGCYLATNGFNVKYNYSVDSKTPDWSLFDSSSRLIGIVEVLNFHAEPQRESEIRQRLLAGETVVYELPPNEGRLYPKLREKFAAYKSMVGAYSVSYVVALCSHFNVDLLYREVASCLLGENGLFDLYPMVSGLLWFQELSGEYHFRHIQNPLAERSLDIPEGVF